MAFQLPKKTLNYFLDEIVRRYSDRPAVGQYGKNPITYQEMGKKIAGFQDILRGYGIGRGDKVALIAPTSPEAALAHLAVMTMGAVSAPIMEEYPKKDIAGLINWIKASAIITVSRIYNDLKDLVTVPLKVVWSLDKEEPLFTGTAPPAAPTEIQEDDLAEILFTSGTTGHSKGVMLTHSNLVNNLPVGPDMVKKIHSESITLSLLPLAHAYGSTSGFLSIIYCGSALIFLGRKPTPNLMMKALQEIRPTILGGVPLIFEKIYSRKIAPLLDKNGFTRFIFKSRFGKDLAYRLFGKRVNQLFGGNIDCAIIGGAPLSEEVERFLRLAKIPTVLGYGMTETSPLITFGSPEEAKMGSVGRVVPDTEIQIRNTDPQTGIGEVWVKGPGVMKGYYENQEATDEIIIDGWLNTGDLGYLDEEGFLFLKGRSKNVILGPSGENIYPETLESMLNSYVMVDEALVLQEEGQLTARIYPAPDVLEQLPDQRERWESKLETIRTEVNEKLPAYSRISRVILQDEPFIMTVTNKIKRSAYYNR